MIGYVFQHHLLLSQTIVPAQDSFFFFFLEFMYGTEFLQPDVGAPDPSLLSTLCFLIGLQTLQPAIACCLSPNLSMPDLAQSLASLLAICLSEGRQTALWTSFISVRTAQTSGLPNECVLFTVFVTL